MKLKILVLIFSAFTFCIAAQTINTTLAHVVNEPVKRNPKTPVLIMLHGYGSNENDLFDIAKSFDSRFIAFSLRAPIKIDQDANAWFSLNRVPGQSFTYDYKEAQQSVLKIRSFISNACKAFQVDSTQVYILGFSQGAMLSYELAFRYPKTIKGIMALSGRLMEETKNINANWTIVAQTNYFVAHGYSDSMIKIEEQDKVESFLKLKNCQKLSIKKYEMQHTISGDELNDIRTWLLKCLTPEKKIQPKK
jgi:phospholipase/carboxylesterase